MDRTALFEVTSEAAAGDARRLTTAANVRAMIGSAAGDDALITSIIDRVSASFASFCDLAVDISGTPPSFGVETCRATWFATNRRGRPQPLILPWRIPIVSITSITENGTVLAADVDYRLRAGGLLMRLFGDVEIPWCGAKIVAEFVAGFDLPAGVPADLEAAAAEQVKYQYQTRRRDQSLLSEQVPDVYQASYGDSRSWIGSSGLLTTVEAALAPYRNWTIQ